MSDLTLFFGNNEDLTPSNINDFTHCDTKIEKNPQRPNNLKLGKNNSFQKNGKLSKPNTNIVLKNKPKFPLTPANVSSNLFESFQTSIVPLHGSLSCSNLFNMPNQLPPENAVGNIEYKRQLLNVTPLRLQHLITQMKWRLAEGDGQAIYEIGVNDDGQVTGLDDQQLIESMNNLCKMAESLNASISIIREYIVGNRRALEILIRKVHTHFSTHEIRIAVLGNMDGGKSTLIGVLTQGVLDNGQGKTRLSTFRHVHEVRSGRTSSISCQLLGFNEHDEILNFYWQKNRLHQRSHEEVVLSSSKLVALIDLAGYHKYQRTTLFALTARRPHLVLLVIPANHGFKGTSIDHCQFALTLGVSIAVVVTKIDYCAPDEAVGQLSQWLKSRRVQSNVFVVDCEKQAKFAATKVEIGQSIPVFPVSCVTGVGIDELLTFLGSLSKPEEKTGNGQAEVWIDQIHYEVPRVEGCVVMGLVYTGLVSENAFLYLGPQKNGNFILISVQSIHRNRLQQTTVENGQYASFAISLPTEDDTQNNDCGTFNQLHCVPMSPNSPDDDVSDHYCVRRGMALLANSPCSNIEFVFKHVSEDHAFLGQVAWGVVVSDIRMLDEPEQSDVSELHKHCGSWIVHCGNVYQKCDMIHRQFLLSSCQQLVYHDDVVFQFKMFPQFVHANYPVVFHRAGQTIKACGTIRLFLGNQSFQNGYRSTVNGRTRHFNFTSTQTLKHQRKCRKIKSDLLSS